MPVKCTCRSESSDTAGASADILVYSIITTATTAAYSFAIQMNLYIAVDVIYTGVEDHAWRFSSAFPRIDYEYVCQDSSR